jgi:hypothetical protein
MLVASHNKSLLVYRGNVLCWSAKTDIQPVAVGGSSASVPHTQWRMPWRAVTELPAV